jgi:hypothetical protein
MEGDVENDTTAVGGVKESKLGHTNR